MADVKLARAPALDLDAPLVSHAQLRISVETLSVLSLRRSRIGTHDVAPLLARHGLAAPEWPNRWSGDGALSCAWVEPHAWLLLDARGPAAAAADAVAHPFMLTDISDRLAAFRLSGARAADLLAAGTASGSALGAGRCARTRLAEEAEVFVQQLSEAPDYRLLIDVGLARYAAAWLRDAARGLLEKAP